MTDPQTWKASERRMAQILGGQRIPVSGRERGYAPDIDGVAVAGRRLAIEHKYGQRILSARVNEAFAQAKAAAHSSRDIPMVTVEETGHGHKNIRVIIMDAVQFAEMVMWYEAQVAELTERVDKADRKCARCGGRVIIEEASCITCGRVS